VVIHKLRALFQSAIALIAVSTGGCTMAKYAPEKFFNGPELELARAIDDGDVSAIRSLGSRINLNKTGKEGMTLLFFAFTEKKYAAMTELVRLGANPEIEVHDFGSPFSVALDQVDPSAFKALLAGGGNPNANYKPSTPMIFEAADDDKLEHLKALIAAKANLNAKNSLGETALFSAIDTASFQAADMLIAAGADVNITNKRGGTFAWGVHKTVERQAGSPEKRKLAEALRDKLVAKGIKFPPDPPQVVRQKMGIPE
jgi:uncharacterized protein